MKTILTLPEARRMLKRAIVYLPYRSHTLAEKLTIDDRKAQLIREILEDSEPGTCHTLERILSLTSCEKEAAYKAINHVLRTNALQIAFANEYDDEGAAYPMMSLSIDLDGLLC